MKVHNVYVDTDLSLGTPGAEIDDGAALIALLSSAKVDVQAVGTVFGNASLENVLINTSRLLSFLGRDIPLGMGAAMPLQEDPGLFDEWKSGYGRTPPWELPRQQPAAADLLVEVARSAPGPVTLLCLGPLTNIAAAVTTAPDIAGRAEVIAMGGSFSGAAFSSAEGQAMEQEEGPAPAEFNARCDPEALDIVLKAGWPVRLFGLETTRRVHFTREDFHALPSTHPAVELLRQQAPGWIDRVEEQGWEQGGCSLHDAVAAAYLLDSSLFRFQPVAVHVELKDLFRRGQTTITASDSRRIQAAVDVDAERCSHMILSVLRGL